MLTPSQYELSAKYAELLNSLITRVASNELKKAKETLLAIDEAKTLGESILSFFKQATSNPTALRKTSNTVKAVLKQLNALHNGVSAGLYKLSDFRSNVKEHLVPLYENLLVLLRENEQNSGATLKVREAVKHLNGPVTLPQLRQLAELDKDAEEEKQKSEEEIDKEDAKNKMELYSNKILKLPTSLRNRAFSLVRAPIVPLGDTRLSVPKVVSKMGIPFTLVSSAFLIFENQLLLAFDVPIASGGVKAQTRTTRLADKRKQKITENIHAFLDKVLEAINDASPQHLTLASLHYEFHPKNANIAFVWLVPSALYKVMDRTITTKNMRWGFPLSSNVDEL